MEDKQKPVWQPIAFFMLLIVMSIFGIINSKRMIATSKEKAQLLATESDTKETTNRWPLQNGDIIFQISRSSQSKAIQLATHSKYSHCGIVFQYESGFVVCEASKTVTETPLDQWIARGQDSLFVVKRLKEANQILSPQAVKKLHEFEHKVGNKAYDKYFSWTNDQWYCSELVWKMFRSATGLKIGELQLLKDFDLTSKEVRSIMKERYGDKVPLSDTVISPVSIFNSDLLEVIKVD